MNAEKPCAGCPIVIVRAELPKQSQGRQAWRSRKFCGNPCRLKSQKQRSRFPFFGQGDGRLA